MKKTKTTYSSNFKIYDNQRMQFLYASQNYGTFYNIYSKFEVEGIDIKSIDFETINYKGILNLGFINDSSISNDIIIRVIDKTLVIGIPLQACTTHNKTQIRDEHFYKKNKITTSDFNNIIVFRGLIKLDGAKNQDDPYFDTEFSIRDGLDTSDIDGVRNGYFDSIEEWQQIKNSEIIIQDGNVVITNHSKRVKIMSANRNCIFSKLEVN